MSYYKNGTVKYSKKNTPATGYGSKDLKERDESVKSVTGAYRQPKEKFAFSPAEVALVEDQLPSNWSLLSDRTKNNVLRRLLNGTYGSYC